MYIWALIWLWPAYATWFFKEDKACDPREEHVLVPYTGFSIQRQYTLTIPPLHHIRLTHCDHGHVDMEAFSLAERGKDMMWATNFCVNTKLCYRAVRRKKYALRELSLYIPHVVVGGLFLCPGYNVSCTNENARPILPLLADRISQQWFEVPRLQRIVQRIPYFYTPDFLDPRYPWRQDRGGEEWAQSLDVNEEYIFTAREQIMISHLVSMALHFLKNMLTLDGKYIIWETDLVYDDLARDAKEGSPSKVLAVLDKIQQGLSSIGRPDLANHMKQLLAELDESIEEPNGIIHGASVTYQDIEE